MATPVMATAPAATGTRPELVALTGQQQDRVLAHLQAKRPTCGGCDGREFRVGDALYLGFLFLSEPLDAYLVALSCLNPACPVPHSGINLHAAQLLIEP